jgi:polyisoprenoid-binding protein YceI
MGMKEPGAIASFVMLVTIVPVAATAQPLTFSVHRTSQATFKTDAPLETVVGTTAGPGNVTGTVTVDPAKPQGATGTIRVDLTTLKTGMDRRDQEMGSARFLDFENPSHRHAVFEVRSVEVAGPLELGKDVPARVRGVLTIKAMPLETVAETRVSYLKLTSADAQTYERYGFTAEIFRVRAKLDTKFTSHGMQVPQLYFLRVANDIQLAVDLTLVRQELVARCTWGRRDSFRVTLPCASSRVPSPSKKGDAMRARHGLSLGFLGIGLLLLAAPWAQSQRRSARSRRSPGRFTVSATPTTTRSSR